MNTYRVIDFRGCHGTRLTDSERDAALNAALTVLEGRDPAACYDEFMRLVDAGDQEAINNHIWSYAEEVAIDAATKGWYRVPDDLTLEIR